ncbi:hypothetical protein EAF04_000902 [Stromatinia cepivora]|nr:hypothetical protein EAF04_000902 [Stromatinia cepivora]
MDHLPILQHNKLPYPIVPCKGSAYVPMDNFPEYPQQHGHHDLKQHLDAGRNFDWQKGLQASPTEIGFLQTWLYFGTLYEVSCAGNKPTTLLDSFIEETSDGVNRNITSEGLDKFLQLHIGALKPGLKPTNKAERFRRLDAVLDKVCTVTKTVYQSLREHMKAHGGFLEQPSDELCIVLSIKILGCTVDNALYDRLGKNTIERWRMDGREKESKEEKVDATGGQDAQSEQRRDWELKSFAEDRMASGHWCPRDVDLAKGFMLSELSMFAASYIARRDRHHNHEKCDRYVSECKEFSKADDSQPSTACHTDHSRSEHCTFWPPDPFAHQVQLRVIVSQKRIPYLKLREARKTTALEVTLKSMENTQENTGRGGSGSVAGQGIIIVSHVWSDGLGSDLAQLPMCQLQRLFHAALGHGQVDYTAKSDSKSFSRRHFRSTPCVRLWIDTLCLPAITWKASSERDEHAKSMFGKDQKTYKTMGIQMMKRYYSFSQFAMVIDGELTKIKMKGSDQGELLLRIALSGWMRRCWCFIEAINSGGFIKISFADGLFDLTHAIVSRAFRANDNWFYLMSSSQRKWMWGLISVQIVATALLITYIILSAAWDVSTLSYDSAKLLQIWMVGNLVGRHQIVPNIMWVVQRLRGLIAKARGVKTSRRGIITTPQHFTLDCSRFFIELGKVWLEGSLAPKFTRRFKHITTSRQAVVWEGFKHRHVSSRPYRVVTFGYACAKHRYEFKTMDRITNSIAIAEQAAAEVIKIPDGASEEKKEEKTAQRATASTVAIMQDWLVGQRVIPTGLLFMNGAKMQHEGYHWAPTDIHRESIKDGGIAKCLRVTKKAKKRWYPEGSLQFKKPGLILSNPLKLQLAEGSPGKMDPIFIQDLDSNARFRVDWASVDEAEGAAQVISLVGDFSTIKNPERLEKGLEKLIARNTKANRSALIISDVKFLPEPGRRPIFKSQTSLKGLPSSPLPGSRSSPAALIAMPEAPDGKAPDGKVYYGIFCVTATITKVLESESESHNYLEAETRRSNQSWVIS